MKTPRPSRLRSSSAVLFLALCAAVPAAASMEKQEGARLEKLIEVAISGSPVVRGQAAERLLGRADEVRGLVLARLAQAVPGENFEGWWDLGPEFLRLAASLTRPGVAEEKDLRKALWQASKDPVFPWRFALVEGLAVEARIGELDRFAEYLRDPLFAVRTAALAGLAKGSAEASIPAVKAALRTETDARAGRAMAAFLLDHEQAEGAWYLWRELVREDRFFDQPVGLTARADAAQKLAAHWSHLDAGILAGEPRGEAATNARRELGQRLTETFGPEPKISESKPAPAGEPVLGLELRSCRLGEVFLRWTDAEQLWIGRDTVQVIALPEGTLASLRAAAQGTIEAMGKDYLTGEAGCDLMGLSIQVPGEKRPKRYLVTKGPRFVQGLTPKAMERLLIQSLGSLPEEGGLRPTVSSLLAEFGGVW
ncbi:MAG: hypothetical protein R3F33_15460 [Planctomycetota bacterium]